MSIGENVKAQRKRCGLTQKEVADRVGVTESLINQVENGRRSLNLEIAKDMARVFGCTVDALVE